MFEEQKFEVVNEVKSAPRVSFPEDEARHPWLVVLLDSYQAMDTGVSEGIRLEEEAGKKLACTKGCSSCCVTHGDIPIYPIELVGITWYATEKLEGDTRENLIANLMHHREGAPCPFLINRECSIHPLRPLACRQFNVFNKVCEEGEDAFYSRREDVLTPIKNYIDEAFNHTLPFYGVTDEDMRTVVLQTGKHHEMAKVLQNMNWKSLAEKMKSWDARPKAE